MVDAAFRNVTAARPRSRGMMRRNIVRVLGIATLAVVNQVEARLDAQHAHEREMDCYMAGVYDEADYGASVREFGKSRALTDRFNQRWTSCPNRADARFLSVWGVAISPAAP